MYFFIPCKENLYHVGDKFSLRGIFTAIAWT